MRTIRLPIAIAGCLCGLAALPAGGGPGGAARAWAAVIVIDNRTPDEVRFSVQSAGAKGTDYRLQPGQVLPLHVEEKVTAAFVSEGVTRRKPLEPNAIYSFQALPGGVDLERTKFPRKAQRQPPLEPARLPHLGAEREAPDFGPSEVIGIKILVDEEQKATRQKWEADLRRAIKAASDVIERHCGLRFEIQSIDAWQSDDRAPGSGQLLADFQKKVDPRPAWLAIGFTSQQRAVRGQAERHPAQIFASHILFRDWKGRIDEAERVEQLVHALGHWLGAVDSPDPTSVMRPPSGDFRARAQKFPLQFDAPNTLLLNVVADQIRGEGPAAWPDLPNRLRQQVAAVWTLIDGQAQKAAPARRPAVAKTRPAPRGRYSALLVDGTKVSGETIRDWGRKADNPRLDEQSLSDPAHPVRWLRDEQQDVPSMPAAFVEMVGGDRLPGKVVRYVPADDGTSTGAEESGGGARSLPAHLVVEPEPGSVLRFAGERPTIRVRTAWLRRIAWQRVGDERYEPNTVRLRSGGAIRFRSLQFTESGVKLLVDEGVEQHPFAEIGEIHLPTIDPWTAWYQQLAMLSPDGRARLVRWETSDGLRVMSSAERFRAFDGPGDRADGWIHMAQPAWSLTPLFVRHLSIRLRTWFEPGEFPLSALDPAASRRQAIFGSAWDWRADQNCRGGALRCGREEFAWGLGVHATSELSFDLPALATGLRTRVGLDRLAGRGGCARAEILLAARPDAAPGRAKLSASGSGPAPLFRSKLLLGSRQDQDTGLLAFAAAGASPASAGWRLTLLADMVAGADRPSGADPLDIRDTVDWLEPLVGLDREALQHEVDEQAPRLIDAWAGWELASGQLRLANRWDKSDARHAHFRLDVLPQSERLTLSRRYQVTSITNRLQLGVTRTHDSTASQIEVLVDGERIARFAVPVQGAKGSAGRTVPLGKYLGRQIEIQVIQVARGERPQADWHQLTIVD